MSRIELDHNYNIKTQTVTDSYTDQLGILIDLIQKARAENRITDQEVKILLTIAISKELNHDIVESFPSFDNSEKTEKQTMFMNFNNTLHIRCD